MTCKGNSVQCVKLIMYLQRLGTRMALVTIGTVNPLSIVMYVQKELDNGRRWHIIMLTVGIRDLGDPASAHQQTETTQARSPETVRHAESASGGRDRSAISRD